MFFLASLGSLAIAAPVKQDRIAVVAVVVFAMKNKPTQAQIALAAPWGQQLRTIALAPCPYCAVRSICPCSHFVRGHRNRPWLRHRLAHLSAVAPTNNTQTPNNFTRSSRWCCLGAPSLLTSLRRYPRQHRLAVVAVVAVDILHAVVAIVAVVLCRRFPSLRFSLRLRLRSALRSGRSGYFCSSCLC